MQVRRPIYFATAAAVLGLLAPAAALAQTDATQDPSGEIRSAQVDEVVVTARRVEENLQDVPVSVTALSGEALREQNVTQVSDLQRVAPSLTVTNTLRGAAYPTYAIRGQRSAYTPTPLSDPSIGLYFAEFTMGQGLGSNSSLYDMESVQVLKGPQGTLFGRNTTGGAILFTPAAPTDDFEGYVQGRLGSYDLRDVEAALNIPLGEMAALRIAGKLIRRDGYTENVLTGQKTDDRDAESARITLRLTPAENIESTFIGRFVRDDSTQAYKLLKNSPRGLVLTAGPALGPLAAGMVEAELAATRALDEREYRSQRSLWASARNWAVQNTTSIDFGGLTFKNIIGYSESRAGSSLDWDGSRVEIFATDLSRTTQDVFSEEAQILGEFGPFDFVAGLYYYESKDTEDATTNILGLLAPIVPPAFPIIAVTTFDSKETSLAGFVHGNYDLGGFVEGLSVSGGVRYTRDKRTVTWYNVAGGGTPARYRCSIGGAPVASPGRNPICAVSDEATFKEPTWDISLNYEATDDLLIYAAHRHGYRAGGFNSAPQPLIPVDFQPETIDDIELGLKSEFNLGGVATRFNGAAYYAWYKDIQRSVGRVLPSGAINQVMMNAASGAIKGAEAELTMQFGRSVTLVAGYAYTKPNYDTWTDVYPAGNVGGAPIIEIDISDSDFAFISEHQFNLSLEWMLPTPPAYGELIARVNVAGVSSFHTQEITTANCGPDQAYASCLFRGGKLPAYAVANARIDWRGINGSDIDLAFFVNNIADTFYRPGSVNALSLGFQSASVGAPRMFGVELRVPFGATAY